MRHLKNFFLAQSLALLLYVLAVAALIFSMPTRAIGMGALFSVALSWIPLWVGALTLVGAFVFLQRRKQPRGVTRA